MSIEIKNVSYTYLPDTPFAHRALNDVSFSIGENECVAVIGHTGSGKSTLMQHLNGLLQPSVGEVIIDGTNIAPPKKTFLSWGSNLQERQAVKAARQKVGLVFQYPEQQLFEETVFDDVAFGVKKQGFDGAELLERVKAAFSAVKLDFDSTRNVSPFVLSGGQMRRAAIAGILAMRPQYLVLDEPTAGLDPFNRRELMVSIMNERRQRKTTVVLVTHSMEIAAQFADRIAVMHRGQIILSGKPVEVFAQREILAKAGLAPPAMSSLLSALKAKGLGVDDSITDFDEGIAEILYALGTVKD